MTSPEPSAASSLCAHTVAGPLPFESVLVLDDHLGPTDWLVRCRTCAAHYLLEMLDWDGPSRLYRVRAPAHDAVAGLLRDLERGSCDLDRAGAEANHFSLSSTRLPTLMRLNLSSSELSALIEASGVRLPGASWRELPCDGSWLKKLG